MLIPLLKHIFAIGIAASVFVGLFLAVVFLRQERENQQTKFLLSSLLLVFSFSVAMNSFLHIFIPRSYPHLWTFPEPFLLLVGPLFYYYIQSLSGSFSFTKKSLFHFLPFVVVGICFAIFVSNSQQSSQNFRNLWNGIGLLWLAAHLQFWAYYFLNRKALSRFREKLKESHSSIERIHQAWIAYCLTALLLCYTILGILFLLGHGNILLPVNQSLAIVLAMIIYSVGYRTLSQPEIFMGLPNTPQNSEARDDATPEQKYRKSGLSGETAALELEKVEHFMSRRKPYLDPDLDLKSLANMLQLTPHHLSQVINNGSPLNFYDFVNNYRIEEAKSRLGDPANDYLTVLGVGFDAGFNSKATFNRFFKKATQQTPSQFRKMQRGQGEAG